MARTPLHRLNPRRICLIKPSALGDVVRALPVLSGLRIRWPDAHISWVVNHSFSGLLENHPELDECIPFQRRGNLRQRLSSSVALFRRLQQRRFDLTVDLQGLCRSAMMTWATAAPRRVGFADAREGATLAYTDHIAVCEEEVSAVVQNWQIAKALGCRGEPPRPRFGWTEDHHAWVRRQLESLPRPILAIHSGAQWETKRWPPSHFAELARRAQREFSAGIVLVGGPGERPLCDTVMRHLDRRAALNLAEQSSLLQLAALLAAADVYLSGDSGPMHLAAAVGTPVVAVFTCTSPIVAGPFGPGHRVVATNVACAASYLKKCRSMICMSELTPERVWPGLETKLNDVQNQRSNTA